MTLEILQTDNQVQGRFSFGGYVLVEWARTDDLNKLPYRVMFDRFIEMFAVACFTFMLENTDDLAADCTRMKALTFEFDGQQIPFLRTECLLTIEEVKEWKAEIDEANRPWTEEEKAAYKVEQERKRQEYLSSDQYRIYQGVYSNR